MESKTDTDVAVISAEDLKWLAEQWGRRQSDRPINMEIFNVTGILDRSTLERRLDLFH